MSNTILFIRYISPLVLDTFEILGTYDMRENQDPKNLVTNRYKKWLFFIEIDGNGFLKPYTEWNKAVSIDENHGLYDEVVSQFAKSNCFVKWKRDRNIELIIG